MVQKFIGSDFVVMLFHYDGIVDEWKDFNWSSSTIHVSADNQTKWWFAKRFLHPDIVAEYNYIFLWDEDLGVENFHPALYLSIVKDEGFEISQPALDLGKSEVHHLITARSGRSKVHRRAYKHDGKGVQCDDNSNGPPCTGWIEVMALVFSNAAWRCVWYMIQNDLIHAWGLDMRLGYCVKGERTRKIGVMDSEYVVHYGLPTLGEPDKQGKVSWKDKKVVKKSHKGSNSSGINQRLAVRRQSYNDYKVFRRRWKKAAESDECWGDPYPQQRQRQGQGQEQEQASFWTQI
ncbi:lysine ketoglutarate reductase trans-splicing-like protein [Perilla frutescens var. hirtella]|nr:lysine ketoglutarate reductase trans-splicing-like protein [Perilla frutescens var. hirtella]